ncbi:hypothetical protein ACJA88_014499 [Fusarium oxysporum]
MSSVTSFASLCDPSQFGYSSLFGAKFSSLQAKLVTNFALDVSLGPGQPNLTYSGENTNFCNVTVTYTHPGYEDAVSVETWLPVDNYNGRLQAIGGSGWVSGRHPVTYWKMASVAGDGYATVTTDAGVEQNLANPDPWALESPGNLNLVALSNFGHVALHDEASLLFLEYFFFLTTIRPFNLTEATWMTDLVCVGVCFIKCFKIVTTIPALVNSGVGCNRQRSDQTTLWQSLF